MGVVYLYRLPNQHRWMQSCHLLQSFHILTRSMVPFKYRRIRFAAFQWTSECLSLKRLKSLTAKAISGRVAPDKYKRLPMSSWYGTFPCFGSDSSFQISKITLPQLILHVHLRLTFWFDSLISELYSKHTLILWSLIWFYSFHKCLRRYSACYEFTFLSNLRIFSSFLVFRWLFVSWLRNWFSLRTMLISNPFLATAW